MTLISRMRRAARAASARVLGAPPVPSGAQGAGHDPFAYYEELRRGGPVHFLPDAGAWIVLGFDEVQRALADPVLFSSRGPTLLQIDDVLIGADAPAHTAMRRLMAAHFSPEALARRSALAAETARRLLRPLREGRELDVVRGFADPYADAVAADITGFDEATVASFAPATAAAAGSTFRLYAEMEAFISAAAPGCALYRQLRSAEGGTLDDRSARSLVRLLWLAGTVETKRAVASSVFLLLRYADERQQVQANPALLAPFITESLRLRPPEHMVPRLTTSPAEIGGATIPPGAQVLLCLAAANRDPARFPEPDALRLGRSPAANLSFGGGAHRCIGAALARSQVSIALAQLFRDAPAFRAAEPLAAVRYAPGAPWNQLERLVIRG